MRFMKVAALASAMLVAGESLLFAQSGTQSGTEKKSTADEVIDKIMSHVSLTGYAHIGYAYNDYDPSSGKSTSSMEITRVMFTPMINVTDKLRLFMMYDFSKPTLHELWGEYAFCEAFNLRAGEFKSPFTIESNTALSVLEQIRGTQAVYYMAGIDGSDGCYGPYAGRDVGIMAHGSFLKVNGHNLFGYSLGLFNGQGINQKDKNKHKDVSGMLSVFPVKDWRIVGSFYIGKGHAEKDNPYGAFLAGEDYTRNRWSVGTEYDCRFVKVRSEYLRGKDETIDSHGGYVMANVHLHPKLDLILSYDYLDKNIKVGDKQNNYLVGMQWKFYKKCRLEMQYLRQDRKEGLKDSNLFLTQLQIGF